MIPALLGLYTSHWKLQASILFADCFQFFILDTYKREDSCSIVLREKIELLQTIQWYYLRRDLQYNCFD